MSAPLLDPAVLKPPLRAARLVVRGIGRALGARWARDTAAPEPPIPDVEPRKPRAPAPPVAAPAAPTRPPQPPLEVVVADTPNPHARQFQTNRTLVGRGSLVLNSVDDGAGRADAAFATALFAIAGVRTVFATRDFVTVTRDPEVAWPALTEAVIASLHASLDGDA
jgi:hypothetical protein